MNSQDPTITVNDLVARYLAYALKRGTYTPGASFAERKRTLELFCASFGSRDVADLKPCDLTDWIEGHAGWKSSSTCRGKYATVQRVMNWAARERRILYNPLAGAEKFQEAPRRPCLDDASLDRICAESHVCFVRALRFLRGTGCRLGDMAQLIWPMILWEQGIAVIGEHKTRKTTGRAKIVPLPESVLTMLKEMRALDSSDGLVFTNRDGRPWTSRSFGGRLNRAKEKLGIANDASIGTAHGLRHQWATIAYRNTGDIKLVSLGLGHKSVAITERFYVHVDDNGELLRKVAEAANQKVG